MTHSNEGDQQEKGASPIARSPADLPYAQLTIKLLGQVQAVDGEPVNIHIRSDAGPLLALHGWLVVSFSPEGNPQQAVAGLCLMAEGRFALIQPDSVRMFDTAGDLHTYGVALTATDSLERKIWKAACLRFPVLSTCEGRPRSLSHAPSPQRPR